jgi:hypothetical protein
MIKDIGKEEKKGIGRICPIFLVHLNENNMKIKYILFNKMNT